jgi:hypothetical protein
MEWEQESFQSQNILVEISRELFPIIFTIILIYLYYRKKINVIDVLLYSFASEAYSITSIGPTITSAFFISFLFFGQELISIKKQVIKPKYLLLMLLPLISSVAVFVYIFFIKDVFTYPGGNKTLFLLRPVYFYLKTYLPLFAIGAVIVKQRHTISFEDFISTIKTIAKVSCIIGLTQITIHYIFNSVDLDEFLGLQHRYVVQDADGGVSLRIQAFFTEPKYLSAFMAISIPIFMRDKSYKWVLFCFFIAILTKSQTFWVNIISAGIIFILLKNVKKFRAKILTAISFIFLFFLTVSSLKGILIEQYLEHQDNVLLQTIAERAIARYDSKDLQTIGENEFLGMPLQTDSDLPVVRFFTDHPDMLLIGYGAANSAFLPPEYFLGDHVGYQNPLTGTSSNTIDMRWMYMIYEFGLIAFIIYFIVLTGVKKNVPRFELNYYAFIWLCFFFCRIDILFLIVVIFSCYQLKENTPKEDFTAGRLVEN